MADTKKTNTTQDAIKAATGQVKKQDEQREKQAADNSKIEQENIKKAGLDIAPARTSEADTSEVSEVKKGKSIVREVPHSTGATLVTERTIDSKDQVWKQSLKED